MGRKAMTNRLNEVKINNQGLKSRVIRYGSATDIDVGFDDGFVALKREYKDFKKGTIKNPYYKSKYGVGFIGSGEYNCFSNIHGVEIYKIWGAMIQRCYSKNTHSNQPTYINCAVCDEWHNFQNFAKWFKDNYYSFGEGSMCLDKDILIKGNKTYSPETCVFVDNRINCLFTKNNSKRGKYPIGVYFKKDVGLYRSQCSIVKSDGTKIQEFLGNYKTPLEAFNVYKDFKENYIKQIADEYKEKYSNFPQKLYQAMYEYKVEITD